MAEHQLPKLTVRVRFSSPAPPKSAGQTPISRWPPVTVGSLKTPSRDPCLAREPTNPSRQTLNLVSRTYSRPPAVQVEVRVPAQERVGRRIARGGVTRVLSGRGERTLPVSRPGSVDH